MMSESDQNATLSKAWVVVTELQCKRKTWLPSFCLGLTPLCLKSDERWSRRAMPEQMWIPPPSEPRRLAPRLATSTERNRSHRAKGLADSTPKPTAGRLCYFTVLRWMTNIQDVAESSSSWLSFLPRVNHSHHASSGSLPPLAGNG